MSIATNRRRVAAAGIVLLAASGIAACSDSGPIAPTGQPPAPPSTEAPPTEEPPVEEPTSEEPPATEDPTSEEPTTEEPTSEEPPPEEPPVSGGGQGVEVSGELTGEVPSGGAATVTLEVTERAAVAVGATSPDGGDLQLAISGGDVDAGIDDTYGYADIFSFDQGNLDPAITQVLEPGSYTLELTEYGGDAAQYQLEVLSGTTVIPAGGTANLEITGQAATLAIGELATGNESIATNGEIDSVLWTFMPSSHTAYEDDDGGDGLNSLIVLPGETVEPVVIAVNTYGGDAGTTSVGIS
ncbi:hypothetical protein [Georgenia sp. Z1491]|uniref:hypothetical protein n=1 Tax=Georgenia sp. Z1491 TaxID=3416707 RepID=UPI003CF5B587